MNLKIALLTGAVFLGASLTAWAQNEHSTARLGADKGVHDMGDIEIQTFQGEKLGMVKDLGVDLVNGRIVEVLVACDSSLGVGDKIVAVPPLALVPDRLNEIYRLNVSADVFRSAAAIDLSRWTDFGRSDRITAAYRLFGQEPYFLGENETASATAARPKVPLGYVERTSRLLDMQVGNFRDEKLGKVCSFSLDIPKGRIRSVIILSPGNFKTESIVPAMALSFNSVRDALLLNDSKVEYANEPHYIFTEAQYGNSAYSREESYKGPRTYAPLQQGTSYRDVDKTHQIYDRIREAKIASDDVEVGTFESRITLRGWVDTVEDKRLIFQIAVAASRVELVDNQIIVGRPSASN
jgi:sporulation protein YlmC with PRC-barrel domain